MEDFVNALIVVLAIIGAVVLADRTLHPITVDSVPIGLPAAHGWRVERAWRPVGAVGELMNPLAWMWNANPTPQGTDADWLIPLPEWLHPFHGISRL